MDKIDDSWDGSLSIGGVPCLPSENVPECAMRLDPPAWILSSDLQYDGTNASIKRDNYHNQYHIHIPSSKAGAPNLFLIKGHFYIILGSRDHYACR